MIEAPIKIKNKGEHGECGSQEKCKSCVNYALFQYLELCSELYGVHRDKEEQIREAARLIIKDCTQKDLDDIGKAWGAMLEEIHRVPIRVRVGLRRGFDFLTVASMSRY